MRTSFLAGAALLAVALIGPANAESTDNIPVAAVDMHAGPSNQVAVLAGGCFWDMDGVFKHVRGVLSVTSGYAGGTRETATYEQVMTQRTRHAEAVRIVYDPRQISYGTLLRIYFSVAHDPTTMNYQGPLRGPAYRSAILPQNARQKHVAVAYIAQLSRAHAFTKPITTRIESGTFFPAEAYQQGYCGRKPNDPYIAKWVKPKVVALRANFPSLAL